MKTLITMSGILLLSTAFAVSQSGSGTSGQPSPSSSPSSGQGQSSYGNNTYDSGAQTKTSSAHGGNTNTALQGRIQDALRNEPTLGSSQVQANVSDSTIELNGTVGSTQDKQTAERIAQSFDGNRKLDDKLVVTGHGHSDMSPAHSAINNGGTGNAPNPSLPSGSSPPQHN